MIPGGAPFLKIWQIGSLKNTLKRVYCRLAVEEGHPFLAAFLKEYRNHRSLTLKPLLDN